MISGNVVNDNVAMEYPSTASHVPTALEIQWRRRRVTTPKIDLTNPIKAPLNGEHYSH